jgi:hypothetical protein
LLPSLGTIAVAAALAFLGSRIGAALARPEDGILYRLTLYSLAGWETLYLLLTALSLAGIAWRLPLIVAAAGALLLAAWLFSRASPAAPASPASPGSPEPKASPAPADRLPRPRRPAGAGWGDGLGVTAVVLFAGFALTLWITISDFVFHWGIKGQRFYLARGVDYAFLARPWNWVIHPDYPNLLPVIFAATALATGGFDARAMMLWSAICFALLLAAAREALCRAAVSRFVAQAALATVALALAAYAIGGETAGSADWLIALAMVAAMPPLLSPPDRRGAAQIGVIAAFAASAKMEGIPLGAFLVIIYLWRLWVANSPAGATRCRSARGAGGLGTAAVLVLPIAAAVLPWLAAVRHYHLFLDFNAGPLEPRRAPQVLAALAAMLRVPPWHGFPYGLALLPLLAFDRRLRPIAALLSLQVAFYLYVFFSVRIDPVTLIQLSFPRLAMHLLPALFTAAAIALDRWSRPKPAAAASDTEPTSHCGGETAHPGAEQEPRGQVAQLDRADAPRNDGPQEAAIDRARGQRAPA